MNPPKVVVVIAQCQHAKQHYGIRLEEKSRSHWVGDWAFKIQPAMAQNEGYDRSEISGSFEFDSSYPGCPYCNAIGLFQCHCHKLACWNTQQSRVKCPWCASQSEIGGSIERLTAGSDH